ncbi:hypothetical protein [Flavobacterium sp.]|uniref:hypothetical protein n=1 Tax=Flavobacterium sp. TaxID=239 RepID=UPI003D6A0466
MNSKKYITIAFLLLNLFSFYGQDKAKINGKLILKDLDNKESVVKNTYIILKSKTQIDSVKVDENLSFTFENLKSDTLRIFISPKSYPVNKFYKFYLKEGEIKKLELPYSPTCPYGKSNVCPICKKKDKVIPIVYGLMTEVKEKKSKYKSGGCVVSDCQPSWYCERNKTEF